jgi:hypothetical protein
VQNRSEEQPRFGTILALVVALILYGSSYPWDFVDLPESANPIWLLLQTWPVSLNRWMTRDVLLNIVLYIPVGAFAYLALARSLRPAAAAALALAGGTALSASIEIMQQFEASRYSSAVDLVTNIVGTAVGVAFGRGFRVPLSRWASTRIMLGHGPARGALVLLILWAFYQLFPLFPDLSIVRLAGGIRAMLLPGSFSFIELVAGLAEWLVAARLVECLAAEQSARLLALLMLLLPARLLIAGRSATASDLLAAAGAWLLWRFWLRDFAKRTQVAAVLALAAIVWRGLAPFEWSPAP